MAKKSLTELLRQEVGKSPEDKLGTLQDTTEEAILDKDTEASTMNRQTSSSASRSNQTKAQLEATVKELRTALEEAQNSEKTFTDLTDLKESLEEANKRESSLQEQITDLQSSLKQQQEFLEKLQKERGNIDQLKTELFQAKEAATQLAKANEKLTQEINSLKKDNINIPKKAKEPLQAQRRQLPHTYERPIQKESERPADFANKTWLL
ncbi:hypothetical protein [Lyngbya aestuarii]|uniref:hypothetical protein n=1 Tax=Lyngbya aestuarii TaxID=118322 RepID=UPI00403DF426